LSNCKNEPFIKKEVTFPLRLSHVEQPTLSFFLLPTIFYLECLLRRFPSLIITIIESFSYNYVKSLNFSFILDKAKHIKYDFHSNVHWCSLFPKKFSFFSLYFLIFQQFFLEGFLVYSSMTISSEDWKSGLLLEWMKKTVTILDYSISSKFLFYFWDVKIQVQHS